MEWWDRIELVCWTRLPGRVTGTMCGQLYIVTSHILVFVLTGYIFFFCIEEEFLNKFASTLQPGVIENELEQSILKLRWDMMEIEDKK